MDNSKKSGSPVAQNNLHQIFYGFPTDTDRGVAKINYWMGGNQGCRSTGVKGGSAPPAIEEGGKGEKCPSYAVY